MKVVGSYRDNGYALLQGLIPPEVALAFLQALRREPTPQDARNLLRRTPSLVLMMEMQKARNPEGSARWKGEVRQGINPLAWSSAGRRVSGRLAIRRVT